MPPLRFGLKTGGEEGGSNMKERGREREPAQADSSRGPYLLQIVNMAMKSMCRERSGISCQITKTWRESWTKGISLAADLSFF